MTTTLVRADELQTLATGDRITAIDGHTLARPLTVATPLADGRIGLKAPSGSTVEHWLYPDTQIGQQVAIEREAPKQAPKRTRAPRPAVSRRWGVTLIATTIPSEGEYKTEDGRYLVTQQWIRITCDASHPVRWRKDQAKWTFDGLRQGEWCPGEQEHEACGWWVYEIEEYDRWGECIADFLPTFRDAASTLAEHLKKKEQAPQISAEAAVAPGERRRTVAGVVLVGGDGEYRTEDGCWHFQHGEHIAYCEGPHPTADGYCDGDQEHWKWAWFVYQVRSDGAEEKADACDTLREAVHAIGG